MKKTLAAVAVLGAFAGSALAADVTLYGLVDLGVKYVNNDAGDSFSMASGNQSGSRFGLKGTEDLGNGLTVGFVLENGFDADTGSLGNGSRLFGRESNLFIRGGFGELSFGRVGQLTSGNGSYGIAGNLSPFGTSWAGAVEGSTFMVGYDRMDNTVTYKTPTFAGVTVYAQYSMSANTKDDAKPAPAENESSADRYYALGATYANGGLNLVAVVDSYNWKTAGNEGFKDLDDGLTVTLGGSYDFEVVKAYLGVQYFDNMYLTYAAGNNKAARFGFDNMEGYAVTAGVDAPVAGGKVMFAAGYTDAESAGNSKEEFDRWGVSVGYDYPMSKRTDVYGVVGYYSDNYDNVANKADDDVTTVMIGLRHKF